MNLWPETDHSLTRKVRSDCPNELTYDSTPMPRDVALSTTGTENREKREKTQSILGYNESMTGQECFEQEIYRTIVHPFPYRTPIADILYTITSYFSPPLLVIPNQLT